MGRYISAIPLTISYTPGPDLHSAQPPATPGHRQCMLYIIMPRHHYFSEPKCIFLCAQQSLHEFLIELQRNNWRCMSQSQRKHLLLLSHLRHYQLLSRRNYHIKGPTRPSLKIMVSASQFHVSSIVSY